MRAERRSDGITFARCGFMLMDHTKKLFERRRGGWWGMGAGENVEGRVELEGGENGLGPAKFGDRERLGVCGLADMLAKG